MSQVKADLTACEISAAMEDAAAYAGSANALRRAGRFDEAEELLSAAVERFPDDAALALARAWLATGRRDWPTALRRWESVREQFPNNPWAYLGSAHALRAAGHGDQSDALVSKAEAVALSAEQSLGPAATAKVALEIAKARADWGNVRRLAQHILDAEPRANADLFLALAQACWHLKEPEAADRAAQQALDVDPALTDAILVQVWVATERGDGQRAIRCYRRLTEIQPDAVRWRLKLVQLLNWHGRIEEAVRELDILNSRWPDDPAVQTVMRHYGPAATLSRLPAAPVRGDAEYADDGKLRALIAAAPQPERWLRPLLTDDPTLDVLTVRPEHAQTALMVFTGSNDRVSMPLTVFDRYLAALPVTVIYLKDFKRLRFLAGIRSLSSGDTTGEQETIRALRRLLADLAIERLCTLGNCDGGFAAIRYGIELGAERVLAFSPPTHAPGDSSMEFEQARNFKRSRLMALGLDSRSDLRGFLESRSWSARIDIFYEDQDPRDGPHALRLEGLPGVHLHPHSALSNHHRLRDLALESGDFCAVLADLLSVPYTARSGS